MLESEKFALIKSTVEKDNNVLSIASMCQVAGVSRSGYYNWINSAAHREQREEQDRADFEKILEAYKFRGYAKGARGIHMRLLHMKIRMNLK